MNNISEMAYHEDKEVLLEEIRQYESEGYVCIYDEPHWNNFGKCWIMMLEKK